MKSSLFALLAALLLAAIATPATAQLLGSDPIDQIIAVVDDDVILRSELDRQVDGVVAQISQQDGQTPPRAEIESQLLERMIDFRVQLQRANSTGIRVTDSETEGAMQRIAQQNNISLAQMSEALTRDGISVEEFRRTLGEQLAVDRLRQRFVQQKVNVTQTEIDNLIASGRLAGDEVRLSHILIAVPDAASAGQIAEAQTLARSVESEIRGGLDFGTAAIRYSRGPQALEGGDLGWRRLDEVPTVLAENVARMAPGDVSAPARGPGGFHIVKLVERRDVGPRMVREFKALHLMATPSELLPPEQARARIEDLRAQIVGGEDFGKLAREFSDDLGSKNQGGDLGWFEQSRFGTVIGEQVAALADDELSQAFQTEQGSWHLIKRLEAREADRSAEMQRTQAEETIRNRKAEEEYGAFVRQIRGESYIENRLASEAEASAG